jgi:ribose transport system permease protein
VGKVGFKNLNQERIVFIIAALIFIAASVGLPGFLRSANLILIVRSISVLGILAIGMGIVIIGRGIDLSMVAIMAMSTAWYLQLLGLGHSNQMAFTLVILGVLAVGALNGFLAAYADVPAMFGYARSHLITLDAVPVPPGHWLELLGQFRAASIPADVFIFAGLCFVSFLFLRFTKWGRYIYFIGENPVAARIAGIPVRPMVVLQYVLSAGFAFIAGLLTAASLQSINTRVVNSNLLYDIVLVTVIGGIGLSGGKGGVRNVLIGAIMIGILLNVMTMAGISLLFQNLIKAVILLIAIIFDGVVNPRDEQTAQQGDL